VLASGVFTKSELISQERRSVAEVPETAGVATNSSHLESSECDRIPSVNLWSQLDGDPAFLGNEHFDNLRGELSSNLSIYLTKK
jgi:hypothetical protein